MEPLHLLRLLRIKETFLSSFSLVCARFEFEQDHEIRREKEILKAEVENKIKRLKEQKQAEIDARIAQEEKLQKIREDQLRREKVLKEREEREKKREEFLRKKEEAAEVIGS